MKPIFYLIVLACVFHPVVIFSQQKKSVSPSTNNGFVQIVFTNTINKKPVVLDDSIYTNPSGENYTISKLKYYVAHTAFFSLGKMTKEQDDYQLINQATDSSLRYKIAILANDYDSIRFLLGVDSIRNTSGAQTDALDPLNDMFWTWNTGYIMFKLEGTSPQSAIVNNKIEYHIGGYKGENNVAKYISLIFPKGQLLSIQKNKTSTIFIEADLNQFWSGENILLIRETPVCSSSGALAKKIAANYRAIFKVVDIQNAPSH